MNRRQTASDLSDIRPQPDSLPAEPAVRKPGLVRKSVSALSDAVNSLKKQDMTDLVETFTAEMTLVAEGLSEDQGRLEQQVAQLSAQQTVADEAMRTHMETTERALTDLRKRIEALEKRAEKSVRQRGTVTQALRQATWIAAILGAAWVITALVRAFGG